MFLYLDQFYLTNIMRFQKTVRNKLHDLNKYSNNENCSKTCRFTSWLFLIFQKKIIQKYKKNKYCSLV